MTSSIQLDSLYFKRIIDRFLHDLESVGLIRAGHTCHVHCVFWGYFLEIYDENGERRKDWVEAGALAQLEPYVGMPVKMDGVNSCESE